jgi:hypothetical protein
MKISGKEIIVLKKIAMYQQDLIDGMKEFKVSEASDLSKINRMVRRGLIQTVGDIFELFKQLNIETQNQLPLSFLVIKQFRNAASHKYGQLDNILAFACIEHCIEKKLLIKVSELIS